MTADRKKRREREDRLIKVALAIYDAMLNDANIVIVRSDTDRAADIRQISELVEKSVSKDLPDEVIMKHVWVMIKNIIEEVRMDHKTEQLEEILRRRARERGEVRGEEEEGEERRRGRRRRHDLQRQRQSRGGEIGFEAEAREGEELGFEEVVEVTEENLDDVIELFMNSNAWAVRIYIKAIEQDTLYENFVVSFKYAKQILPKLLARWRGRAIIYMSKEMV
ncbi:MAG: hypothetical protein QXS96_04730 [Candidatus Caldarchaeum sp.]